MFQYFQYLNTGISGTVSIAQLLLISMISFHVFNTIMYDMYIYVFVRSFYLQCFNWLLCVKYITSLLFKTICRNTYIVKFIKLLLSYTKTELEIDEFMYVYVMWKSRCITRCPIGIHGRRWSHYWINIGNNKTIYDPPSQNF